MLHHGDVIIHSQAGREPPHPDNLRLHQENTVNLIRRRPMKDLRIHYRIVFKELCTPLLDAPSIPAIWNTLVEVTEGS